MNIVSTPIKYYTFYRTSRQSPTPIREYIRFWSDNLHVSNLIWTMDGFKDGSEKREEAQTHAAPLQTI